MKTNFQYGINFPDTFFADTLYIKKKNKRTSKIGNK
jgi:hypothetical protein